MVAFVLVVSLLLAPAPGIPQLRPSDLGRLLIIVLLSELLLLLG
jgi:hypothetical protein